MSDRRKAEAGYVALSVFNLLAGLLGGSQAQAGRWGVVAAVVVVWLMTQVWVWCGLARVEEVAR